METRGTISVLPCEVSRYLVQLFGIHYFLPPAALGEAAEYITPLSAICLYPAVPDLLHRLVQIMGVSRYSINSFHRCLHCFIDILN